MAGRALPFIAVAVLAAQEFRTVVPERDFGVILARPTDRSVTASLLAHRDVQVSLEYEAAAGSPQRLPASLRKDIPLEVTIGGLQPATPYRYRVREIGGAVLTEGAFHTQRAPGDAFTFAVQADSHLDENTTPEFYLRTLAAELDAKPDFLIDLGDTFMTEKRRPNFREAEAQYLAQRSYFSVIGHSVPVLLALGNHDGEGGALNREMAEWSLAMRKKFFPNPRPDGFYTGNSEPLENYYAFQWGDALLIVLDPFWSTTGRPRGDNWGWTLGDAQYRWLAATLSASRDRYRFVFIHHPTGAKGRPIRGGVEAARYNEWGGRNEDGSDGFAAHRPNWPAPIHRLLADHGVNAVFHGHDHFYAREELDGVVYQLVPQPGLNRPGVPRAAREYGYTHGPVLGGAGFIAVRVSPQRASVEYVRTDGGGVRVAASYELSPRGGSK